MASTPPVVQALPSILDVLIRMCGSVSSGSLFTRKVCNEEMVCSVELFKMVVGLPYMTLESMISLAFQVLCNYGLNPRATISQ